MNNPKVLVIDDNRMDYSLMREIIKSDKEDAIVTSASSFRETVIKMNTKGYKPDVVFLDLSLSEKDSGYAVYDWIRERYKKLPIVIYSSSIDHKDITKSEAIGASAYLHKNGKIKGDVHGILNDLKTIKKDKYAFYRHSNIDDYNHRMGVGYPSGYSRVIADAV